MPILTLGSPCQSFGLPAPAPLLRSDGPPTTEPPQNARSDVSRTERAGFAFEAPCYERRKPSSEEAGPRRGSLRYP